MIFRSLLSKVMTGIADLSPVKNLIKYILDRTLNEFLSDQVKIEDFKDIENAKLLLLTNISLNLDKINRQTLLSSPYILHTGQVRQLKIKLPNWSELATRSIEVTVDGLMLDFKPNKSFAANFKQAMKQQQQNEIIEQMQEPGQITQSNPLDFFRQLVKQMLLNMLIKIQNVAVRLFINQPSHANTTKPQYFLMFRMPLLTVGKAEDAPHQQKEVEIVRFDVDLPQLSVHLLRQGTKYPQFANQKATARDYPFKYPTVSHPGTLLLMGKSNSGNKEAAKLKLTLTTNFKDKKKQLLIEGRIGSIEATIDPIQLKIFSRFLAQVQQFQKILKSVMIQLGLISVNSNLGISHQSVDLTLSRNNSGPKSNKQDLFSSVMMSISQPRKNKTIDLYNSITSKPELKDAANTFNQSAQKQLKKSGQQLIVEEGYKHVNFKQELKFTFNLGIVRVNLMKYVSPIVYQRGWSIDGAGQEVNLSLGCSHFRGQMRELNYSFNTVDNKHSVSMKYVTIHDVKLPNLLASHHSFSDEFYDLDSSTFYNQQVNQDYFTNQPQIHSFKLTHEDHYCMQQLLRVSDGACPPIKDKFIRRYAFMPDHESGKGQGLMLVFNSHNKVLRIQVKEVAVMANFQVWKDMLNIIYPIFLYKQLASKININVQDIKYNMSEPEIKFNPFQSAYIFSGNLIEEVESKQHPFALHIDVELVYCLYRQTEAVKPNHNLISQVENKIFDYDNFSKSCFCHLSQRALYAQSQHLQFEKQRDYLSLEVKEIKTGFINLKDSKTNSENIQAFLVVQGSRIQQNQGVKIIQTKVYMRKSKFILELPQLIKFIDMVKNIIGAVDSLLSFKRSLSSKIVCIQLENGKVEKQKKQKAKKQKVLQILAEQISLQTILVSTYINSLLFRKEEKSQQIKIKSLAIGLMSQLETCLGEFRHDIMLTKYPHTSIYPGIRDSLILFELGRQNLKKNYNKDFQSKNKKRSKLQFFNRIDSSLFSLTVFFKRKTQMNEKKLQKYNNQKKFQFNKNPKKGNNSSNIIEEQKYCKNIEILLGCPPHIHLGNILFLVRQKDQLQKTINQITSALNDIKRESREIIIERKASTQSIEEQAAQIAIKIKGGLVMIDIRPDFSYDPEKKYRVLSNTRLFIQLNLNKLQISICQDLQQVSFELATNLELSFLHHLDRDVQTNPIFISKQALKQLGFSAISKIGQIVLKGDFSGRTQKGSVQCIIDEIILNICVSSIPVLELFSQHLLKHSLLGDFGDDQSAFELLEQQLEEPEIIAVEQIQMLQKKLEQKNKIKKMFEANQFLIINQPTFKGINLKKLHVMKITMSFYGGQEFKFTNCNAMNQSKATVRVHATQPDLSISFLISIDKFLLQASFGLQTKAQVQFQRLSVDYVFKRVEGLVWLEQKKYNWNVFKIERPMRVYLHLNQNYFKVKSNHLQVSLAFTDSLFSLIDIYTQAAETLAASGWKKSYLRTNKKQLNRMILAIMPASQNGLMNFKVILSVQLKNNKILSDRILRLRNLCIHEEQENNSIINAVIKEWLQESLKDNFGTIVTGALTQFIATCVQFLFGAVRHTFAFFLPSLRE